MVDVGKIQEHWVSSIPFSSMKLRMVKIIFRGRYNKFILWPMSRLLIWRGCGSRPILQIYSVRHSKGFWIGDHIPCSIIWWKSIHPNKYFQTNPLNVYNRIWLYCISVYECAGNCRQYLRGGVGYHQTRHILWDQCVASFATTPHLQGYQVSHLFNSRQHVHWLTPAQMTDWW